MIHISQDVRQQALDSLQSLLKGDFRTALASAAAFNMIFSEIAAFSLRASTMITNQFPITASSAKNFDWDNIPPNTSLQWHDCFGDFKCARLQVPMDWRHNTTEKDKTVELAVIKLEATVPVTDPTYGGLVFFNPGGPGGSGVKQILKGGHALRTIISAGPDANLTIARNFDVISFDPRGVNNTRPYLSCYPDHIEEAVWYLEKNAQGFIGDSSISFDNVWARMRGLAEGCSKRIANEGFGKHMSTAPVARDIAELFERHGEWREAEAKRLIKSSLRLSIADSDTIMRRSAYKKGKETIQYWGFSYGTVLGAHLAAMYPDRVGRLLLDGVADSYDYMAGAYSTNLVDTDSAFLKLAEYCWAGGEKHCPIWHPDGPVAIIDRIMIILDNFQQNPISRPGNNTHGSAMVNYHDYELFIQRAIYNPLMTFPTIVQVIYELGQGVTPTLQDVKAAQAPPLNITLSQACLKDGPYSVACQQRPDWENWDASYGVVCSDGQSRLRQTKEEFKEYANMLLEQSSLLGAPWAEIQLPCTAWHARSAWRHDGDFVARTAHPVMLIGNTYDPVTPLQNAFKMAKGFEGSLVLHQNSEGHCSYASASMCTGKAVREYFQTGDLPVPAPGGEQALCEPDILPLSGYAKGSKPDMPAGESDRALWDAMVHQNQFWD